MEPPPKKAVSSAEPKDIMTSGWIAVHLWGLNSCRINHRLTWNDPYLPGFSAKIQGTWCCGISSFDNLPVSRVQGFVGGRLPRNKHRGCEGSKVEVDSSYLWVGENPSFKHIHMAHIIQIYRYRRCKLQMCQTSLWFQPSKWESSPNRGENKKYLKPPPSKASTDLKTVVKINDLKGDIRKWWCRRAS